MNGFQESAFGSMVDPRAVPAFELMYPAAAKA